MVRLLPATPGQLFGPAAQLAFEDSAQVKQQFADLCPTPPPRAAADCSVPHTALSPGVPDLWPSNWLPTAQPTQYQGSRIKVSHQRVQHSVQTPLFMVRWAQTDCCQGPFEVDGSEAGDRSAPGEGGHRGGTGLTPAVRVFSNPHP